MPIRTATKRASGGKSANNSTAGRRLGPKKGEGEFVQPGQIIWRQRGTKWYPGENTGIGRDHTIFAKEPGYVRYYRDPFHAKRRFIGIALTQQDRLPTPHFEPRRRRFGYTAIDNEEVAQFELEFLTRKETQRALARESIFAARADARSQRITNYTAVLKSAGIPDPSTSQLSRLDTIYQYIVGGQTYEDARALVNNIIKEDIVLDSRTGRLSADELSSELAKFEAEAAKTDAAVAFGASRQLAPTGELDAAARDAAIQRIASLAEPHISNAEGTPEDVVAQVLNILKSTPSLSASDAAHLKLKFLRRASPVEVSHDARKEFEKKVKKGEGELQRVWDEKTGGLKQYFVPKGSKFSSSYV